MAKQEIQQDETMEQALARRRAIDAQLLLQGIIATSDDPDKVEAAKANFEAAKAELENKS